MTTYTSITNGQIDRDSSITQPLMTALRDNPTAIAEGSENAPKVASEALNMTVGTGDAASSGSTVVVALTMTDLDRISNLAVFVNWLARFESIGLIRYRTSTDNGSSWSAYTTIASPVNNSGAEGQPGSAFLTLSTAGSINAVEFSIVRTSGNNSISLNVLALAIAGITP